MVYSDDRNEGAKSSRSLRNFQTSPPRVTDTSEILASGEIADFVFRAPKGSIISLGGTDAGTLRILLNDAEPVNDCRVLFMRLQPALSVRNPMSDRWSDIWPRPHSAYGRFGLPM